MVEMRSPDRVRSFHPILNKAGPRVLSTVGGQSHSRYIINCRPERCGWYQAVGVSDEGAARSTWPPFQFRRAMMVSSNGIGYDVRGNPGQGQVSPFKVGDRGVSQITEICSWEFCVLYHSIISGPLFSPFPFSARVDMHVEASETVASDSIDLAHCLQFIVPQLCLARPSPHFLMVQWASHCPASRDDPERLGGILSHPLGSELEARRDSLSARMVIPFGFTSNGSTHIHSPRSCPKIGSHQRRCG